MCVDHVSRSVRFVQHEEHSAAQTQPNGKEFFTTKDTKSTKFGVLVIQTLRDLRGETVFKVIPAKPNLSRLLNCFAAITPGKYLHRIERPAAVALFDLKRRQGAIGASHLRITFGHLLKCPAAPFE